MIQYMIVEDEYILGYRLERMISELRPDWILACRTAGVDETVEALKTHKVDLIFMDIELSDGNCFEIFDHITVRLPVIFTTAYDEYAIQAFKADCVEYLLKPITRENLAKALDKLERLSSLQFQPPDYKTLKEQIRRESSKSRLLIPEGSGYIFVNLKDVAYFTKEERYTDVRTFDGRSHLIDKSLDQLETEVDGSMFFRTSRKCMINVGAITSIQRHNNGRLRVITDPPCSQEIIVAQARREEFLNWIEDSATI